MGKRACIGIVTVTYNSGEVLPEFLECLMAQTYTDFALFAVDNASQDNTLDLLASCADPRLTVIRNPDNRGVAEGNNQGIRAALDADCEAVLLINNDTEFGTALLAHLVRGLDCCQADMICPKMLLFSDPTRIWAAGGVFRPWLGYQAKHLGGDNIDDGRYDCVRQVTYVPTCCVLIRKKVFQSIGLMDARYFVYVDDVDFMYRAMRARVRLVYLPHAKLLHKVGRLTGGETSPSSIRYGTRNRIFFLLKHFGLIRTLPWLLLCQLYYAAKLLSRQQSLSWLKLKQAAFVESLTMYSRTKSSREL